MVIHEGLWLESYSNLYKPRPHLIASDVDGGFSPILLKRGIIFSDSSNKYCLMDKLEIMRLFVRVAELGNFSRAAREAGLSQPQVSRSIRALELSLGVQLLQRTTRQISLTSEGMQYLARVREVLDLLELADEEIRVASKNPVGKLRLTAPVGFGQHEVAPIVSDYLRAYPEIEVSFVLTDRHVDLIEEGYDLAIRIGHSKSSSLQIRRLGYCVMALVATRQYIESYGTPTHPQAIEKHQCIIYTSWSTPTHWILKSSDDEQTIRVSGRFHSNNLSIIREVALAGMGIANLPVWLVGADLEAGNLISVLPDWNVESIPVNIVLPPGQNIPRRTRLFIEQLQNKQNW